MYGDDPRRRQREGIGKRAGLLRGDAPTELDAHLVEARRMLAAGAAQEKERVVDFHVVRRAMRAIEPRAVDGQRVCRAELIACVMVEIRHRLVERDVLEALDDRLSLHTRPFVAARQRHRP